MKCIKILSLFFALSLCLAVNGQSASLLQESFDNATSDTVPTGWSNSGGTSERQYTWRVVDQPSFSTLGKCMCFNSYSASLGTIAILKTPSVNLVGNYHLKFKYNNYNAGKLHVYISTDGGATFLNHPLDTTTLVSATNYEWDEVDIPLLQYSGAVKIVFYSVSNFGFNKQYIDDVEIYAGPSCRQPVNIYTQNVTTTSADLFWGLSNEGDNPSGYLVDVTDEQGAVICRNRAVTATTVSLTGLTANTKYIVNVRSDCSQTGHAYSKYETFSFKTACNPQGLPYSDNFDNVVDMPNCSDGMNVNVSQSYYAGLNGKSMQLSSTTGTGAYLLLPTIAHAANDMQMTCKVRRNNLNDSVLFGIGICDPTDPMSTFETMYDGSLSEGVDWREVRVNTSTCSYGTQSNMAMCIMFYPLTSTMMYVDDVKIEPIPTCIRPENLTISGITTTGCTVDWGVASANSYTIKCKGDDGSEVVKTATTHPYTVTGLNQNTRYVVTVQAQCTQTDTSETSHGVVFRTLCAPLTTPIFLEDAESTVGMDLPSCWFQGVWDKPSYVTEMEFFRTTGKSQYDDNVHSGNRAFVVTGGYDPVKSYMYSPAIVVNQANQYSVSIWMRRESYAQANEGLTIYVSPQPNDTIGGQRLGFISRDANATPQESDGSGWYKYTYPIPMTGTLYVIIGAECSYQNIMFDDVEVRVTPTCLPVTKVTVGTPTTNTCALSWTGGTQASQWILEYELQKNGTVVRQDTVATSSANYTLTGLQPGSEYTVSGKVYVKCSATDISDEKNFRGQFVTLCDVISQFPYTEDFEGNNVPPMCWITGSNQQICYWTKSGGTVHGGQGSAYVISGNNPSETYLSTGEMTFNGVNQFEVGVWVYRGEYGQNETNEGLKIYVGPSQNDLSQATLLGFVAQNYLNSPAVPSTGWYKYTYEIPSNISGSNYILFVYNSVIGNLMYIDDVEVRQSAACGGITANIDIVDHQSARVSVSKYTSWEIEYGEQNRANKLHQTIPAGTDTFLITGLVPESNYEFRVRRFCVSGDTSAWSKTYMFQTLPAPPSCYPPVVTVSNIMSGSVNLNITSADASMWEVNVSSGATMDGDVYSGEVNTSIFTVPGLAANTEYYYMVRAICAPGDTSAWTVPDVFTSDCMSEQVPYFEQFDNIGSVECWRSLGNIAPVQSSTFSYSGKRSLKVTDVMAISPELDVTSLAPLAISGMVYTPTDATQFSIGVISDPEDEYSFEGMASQSLNVTAQWTPFKVYLDDLLDPIYSGGAANAKRIAFFVPAGSVVYFDDITIDVAESCHQPMSVDITNAQPSSFDISWDSDAPQHRVIVVQQNGGDGKDTVVTSNPATIRNLRPMTDYSVMVAAICSQTDTSAMVSAGVVRTGCGRISTPFYDNFESYEVMTVPNCWDIRMSSTATMSTIIYPDTSAHPEYIWNVFKYGNNKMMRLFNERIVGLSTRDSACIVTPLMRIDGDSTVLALDYSHRASCGPIAVNISDNDGQTFVNVDSLYRTVYPGNWSSTDPGVFYHKEIDLSAYNGRPVIIQLSALCDYGLGSVFVDNVQLLKKQICVAPSGLQQIAVGQDWLAVGWYRDSTIEDYVVKITDGVNSMYYPVDTICGIRIGGLNSSSRYEISVASISANGDTSLYSSPIVIKTLCAYQETPYFEDFESQIAGYNPECWDISTSTTVSATERPDYVWGVSEYAGNKFIRMYNYLVHDGNAIISMPPFSLGAGHGYLLKYKYSHRASCGALNVEVSDNGGSTFTQVASHKYGGLAYDNDDPGIFNENEVDLTPYSGNDIIIRLSCKANFHTGSVFIDDISIESTSMCQKTQGLTLTYTDTAVTAVVTDTVSSHTQWQYACIPYGESIDTFEYQISTSKTITITGLTSATAYQIYVRAYCDSVEQSVWDMRSFRTNATSAGMPFVCDFTDEVENQQWMFSHITGNRFIIGNDSKALYEDATAALYVTDGTSYTYNTNRKSSAVAYREIEFGSGRYVITFDWKCPGGEMAYGNFNDYARMYLVPGTTVTYPMSGPFSPENYPSNIIPLDGNNAISELTNVWKHLEQTVDLTGKAGKYCLVFAWVNNEVMGGNEPLTINNIKIDDENDFCLDIPSAVTVDQTTAHTATVSVKTRPSYRGIQFAYALDGVDVALGDTIGSVNSATGVGVIGGLVANTAYKVYARAFCSSGDTTSWTDGVMALTMSTDCFEPQNVRLLGISDTSATIAWGGAPDAMKYQYDLGGDTYETIKDTIVLTGLHPHTEYTFNVKTVCNGGVTTDAASLSFLTLCGIMSSPYSEGFETISESYTSDNMIEEICWSQLNASSNLYQYPQYMATTDQAYVAEGGKCLLLVSSMAKSLYMVMPEFENVSNKKVMFSSRVSDPMSSGTLTVGYLTDANSAQTFVDVFNTPKSIVKSEYAAQFGEIPEGARIAFRYGGASQDGAIVSLDNVRVVDMVEGEVYTDTICYATPYSLHGFSVSSDQMSVGDNVLTRFKSGITGAPDTIITANVYMKAMKYSEEYDTCCAGIPSFDWKGITVRTDASDRYIYTTQSADMCDSTVTLFMHVIPTHETRKDTICEGDTMYFYGQKLTAPGTYSAVDSTKWGCVDTITLQLAMAMAHDTIHETICNGTIYYWHGQQYTVAGNYDWHGTGDHGCPLRETLVLNVLNGNFSHDETICQGGYYLFLDTVLRTAGTYTKVYEDAELGCYITETVVLYVNPPVAGDVYDHSCEGVEYMGYGVVCTVTSDTVITVSAPSTSEGCDSVTNIHIDFIPTVHTDTVVKLPAGSTFTWHDNTYTKSGKYDEKLVSSLGCDSIVTLHLTIGDGTDNISTINIEVVPNPIEAGMMAYIYGDYGEVERVDIFNNYGQMVGHFVPSTYPIEVNGIQTSGLYYVRIITNSGEVYTEKLIVK